MNSVWTIEGPGELPEEFFAIGSAARMNDPTYIPEVPEELRERFRSRHWWFESGGLCRVFLAGASARLAAFVHPQARTGNAHAGFFGWWASAGDTSADDLVFEAAQEFLSQHNCQSMIGPVDQSSLFGYRLLDQRSDSLGPFPDEPDTPVRMAEYLMDRGFRRLHSYNTRLVRSNELAAINDAIEPVVQRSRDSGFEVEPLTPEAVEDRVDEIANTIQAVFADNIGFVAPPDGVIQHWLVDHAAPRMCPDLSMAVYTSDRSLAGWMLVYPHYGPLVWQQRSAGRVTTDTLTYARHFGELTEMLLPHRPWAVCKTVAFAPQFQDQGLVTMMVYEANKRCVDTYDGWMLALSRMDNHTQGFYQPDAEGRRLYSVYEHRFST